MKLNLGSGTDHREGYLNMDAFAPKADLRHDFTNLPWPIATGSIKEVYASHVMEHIPLIFLEREGVKRDIFFDIMEELHRVMAPGSRIEILVPWGGSDVGYCHPQHYRQITPNWFHYFTPECHENYYSTARFKIVSWKKRPMGLLGTYAFPIGRTGPKHGAKWGLTSHLIHRLPWLRKPLTARRELQVILECLKN